MRPAGQNSTPAPRSQREKIDRPPRLFLQLLRLQSSLEESQLNEKQLKHQLEVQSESLNSKVEELRALSERAHTSFTSEMVEVELRVAELENIKVSRSHAEGEEQLRMMRIFLFDRSSSGREILLCVLRKTVVCPSLGGAGGDAAAGRLQGAAAGAVQ